MGRRNGGYGQEAVGRVMPKERTKIQYLKDERVSGFGRGGRSQSSIVDAMCGLNGEFGLE